MERERYTNNGVDQGEQASVQTTDGKVPVRKMIIIFSV